MQVAIIDHKRCEILLTRYREQAANMRHLNQMDLWGFVAFMALQLAIIGLVSIFLSNSFTCKAEIFIIDTALLIVCLQVAGANKIRRDETRTTILNINEALALYAPDVYLPNRAINPPHRPNHFVFYSFGYWTGFLCVTAALYFAGR
jgi:hypothetical protein